MTNNEIIIAASKELELRLNDNDPDLRLLLAEKINELINSDFPKLISLLYKIDVSESKLQQILKANRQTDAGSLIADLVIERQREKMRARQEFGKKNPGISDEEKW